MTRKRSVAAGLFAMPAMIADAALGTLTPAQREGINANKAAEIMTVCVDTARRIGTIVERVDPPAGPLKREGGL
jgi:hypothetical protein